MTYCLASGNHLKQGMKPFQHLKDRGVGLDWRDTYQLHLYLYTQHIALQENNSWSLWLPGAPWPPFLIPSIHCWAHALTSLIQACLCFSHWILACFLLTNSPSLPWEHVSTCMFISKGCSNTIIHAANCVIPWVQSLPTGQSVLLPTYHSCSVHGNQKRAATWLSVAKLMSRVSVIF